MNTTFLNSTLIFSSQVGPVYGPLYLLVCMLGILCNTAVVIAFVLKIVPLTPFCMLLLNLSVTDILTGITFIPGLFDTIVDHTRATPNNPLSTSFMCAMVYFRVPSRSTFIVNNCTVAYMSFIRASSFDSDRSKILKRTTVKRFIFCIWMLALLYLSPWYFLYDIGPESKNCEPKSALIRTISYIHGSVTLLTFYIAIEVILLVNIIRSVRFLWKKSMFTQSIAIRERNQITFLLVILAITYCVFGLPFLVRVILRTSGQLKDKDLYSLVLRPTGLVYLLTLITDPALYAFYWKGFRNGFRKATRRNYRTSTTLSTSRSVRADSGAGDSSVISVTTQQTTL